MLFVQGQQIVRHDVIKDVMYAPTQENGHVVWKKWWYAFMSKVSLRIYLYMIHEDHVFVTNMVVTNLT
jgi:hypothetical protein